MVDSCGHDEDFQEPDQLASLLTSQWWISRRRTVMMADVAGVKATLGTKSSTNLVTKKGLRRH